MDNREEIIAAVRNWVNRFVIGLSICPFARSALPGLRILIAEQNSVGNIVGLILEAAADLDQFDPILPATTLVILPDGFKDFDDYLDLVATIEIVLTRSGYNGIIQVATFHPNYVFEDEDPADLSNFTNRSPYPILHLLRESDVSTAIDAMPDPMEIPRRNQKLLRSMNIDEIEKLIQ